MGSGNSRMEEVAPVRRRKRRSVASFFCVGTASAAEDDTADSVEVETRLQENPVRNQPTNNFTKSSEKELQNSHSERAANQPSTSSNSTIVDIPTVDLNSSEISENYSYPSSILATPIQEPSGRTVINTRTEGTSENEPTQTEETNTNNRSINNTSSNNRRSIWETFSRHGSRRNNNNNNSEVSDGDELAFYDRWLDLGDEIFGESIEDELRSSRRRRHASSALNWQSRSLMRERAGFNSSERRRMRNNSNNYTMCPNGLHSEGTCACTVFSSAEASISRIVMLTEALFEVLDEIHRHPTSLSLSSTSNQAPESVVNSLPLKIHKKSDKFRSNDDVEQCYICLTEYEEGEKIRVLPCNHEFHMSCVDKWLKEVHRVCPLCRGDVCENSSGTFS